MSVELKAVGLTRERKGCLSSTLQLLPPDNGYRGINAQHANNKVL